MDANPEVVHADIRLDQLAYSIRISELREGRLQQSPQLQLE